MPEIGRSKDQASISLLLMHAIRPYGRIPVPKRRACVGLYREPTLEPYRPSDKRITGSRNGQSIADWKSVYRVARIRGYRGVP
jgi:hypothetical protein